VDVLCLDLEGVLIPEIWIGVAERTGIEALRKTTREVPVYDELMQLRLAVLAEHGIGLDVIRDVVGAMEPLPGAAEFLRWARERYQVAIVSDTFYEFATPLMRKLESPMLLCHRLCVDDGSITGYQLRQPDPKRQAVRAFQGMNYQVYAAGDSFNDIPMLEQADHAYFFNAPENVTARYPQFPCAGTYAELQRMLLAAASTA
jgi:phosphoserine / homoserine phosphotransferase